MSDAKAARGAKTAADYQREAEERVGKFMAAREAECDECHGSGRLLVGWRSEQGRDTAGIYDTCRACGGTGRKERT